MDRVGVLCRVAQATRLMRATTPRASLRLESLRLNICKDNAPLRPPSVAHKRARQSEVAHKDNELCPIRSSRFPRGDRRYPPRGTRPLPFGGLQRDLPWDQSRASPETLVKPPKGYQRSLGRDTSEASEGTPAEPLKGHERSLPRDRSESPRGHERKLPFRGGISVLPTPSTDSLLILPLRSYREPTCALTESPHTLLPRALRRSYRERKRALGKSADLLSISPIQRELAGRSKTEVIIPHPTGGEHRGMKQKEAYPPMELASL